MRRMRDPKLNMGCANCRNFSGIGNPNVINFKCAAGIDAFRIYFCPSFQHKKMEVKQGEQYNPVGQAMH